MTHQTGTCAALGASTALTSRWLCRMGFSCLRAVAVGHFPPVVLSDDLPSIVAVAAVVALLVVDVKASGVAGVQSQSNDVVTEVDTGGEDHLPVCGLLSVGEAEASQHETSTSLP